MKWPKKQNNASLRLDDAPDFRLLSTEPASPKLAAALKPLYSEQNGCFAFADALHIFWSDEQARPGSLEWWNDQQRWQANYDIDMSEYVFFAEDIFGWQFAALQAQIYLFDPYSAEFKLQANTVDEWMAVALANPTDTFGYAFAQQWRDAHGAISDDTRMMVYPPFLFADNGHPRSYRPVPRLELISFAAEVYAKVKDLPKMLK